jgi:biofilm protein TabA
MAIFGSLATLRAQAGDTEKFRVAFAYLEEVLRPGGDGARRLCEIAEGKTDRVELGGGVFALEQAYRTKDRRETAFESHRAHIDIQVIVEGEEIIEVQDIAGLRIKEDRTPGQDILFYQPQERATVLHLKAGEAAILYPVDGHMPSLSVGAGSGLVRKTVVKVPVG